ncbi:MAG: hypothetical protein JRN15_00320 [Nitrososphaerota archaeon]|nr:hypothetical protein [Nitrososphaerota archaeon]
MNKSHLAESRRAISPIIATLLLILIAIAAGVVVYAYVIGFIGNSTTNAGISTNTISTDELALNGTSTTGIPVTAYVRNEGPSSENFNTGFFLKGSSLNYQLGPAVSISTATGTITAISTVTLVAFNGAAGNLLDVEVVGVTCSSIGTQLTASAFGVSATNSTATCSTLSSVNFELVLYPNTVVLSSTFNAISGPITLPTTGFTATSKIVVGTSVSQGTISIPINQVFDFTLAPKGAQVNSGATGGTNTHPNLLGVGITYTVQVTGTDGSSAVASAKAS